MEEKASLGSEWWREREDSRRQWIIEMLRLWRSSAKYLLAKFEASKVSKYTEITDKVLQAAQVGLSALETDVKANSLSTQLYKIATVQGRPSVLLRLQRPLTELLNAISITQTHKH